MTKLPSPNPEWSAAFSAWLDSSPVEDRPYNPKTIKRYTTIVRIFLEFCRDFGLSSLDEANSAVLRGYIYGKNDDGAPKYAASTRIVMQSALNLFWTWAMDMEYVVDNQLEKLIAERSADRRRFGQGGRKGMRLPKVLSWEQQDDLLRTAKGSTQAYVASRDSALISLLMATGLRREEAASLQITDLDLAGGQLRVVGKGDKERVVRFDPADCGLADAVTAYLRQRPASESGALFLARNGKPMSHTMIYQQISKNLKAMSRRGKIDLVSIGASGPHILRHTAASRMLAKGTPVIQVQANMGHANLATLQIYAHLLPART